MGTPSSPRGHKHCPHHKNKTSNFYWGVYSKYLINLKCHIRSWLLPKVGQATQCDERKCSPAVFKSNKWQQAGKGTSSHANLLFSFLHTYTKIYRAIHSHCIAGREVILVQMSSCCIYPECLAINSFSQLVGRHVIYSFTNVSPL